MNIYDIGIEPGGVHTINVQADYIYFRTGTAGGGDTTVVFQPSAGGEAVYLQPGQAYKMPTAMRGKNVTWVLRNLRGEGRIAGVILMGEGEFQDNRVSGSVEVIDGGKARTLAGLAFSGAWGPGALGASEYARIALFNPANSKTRVVIEAVAMSCQTAVTCNLYTITDPLLNDSGTGGSKDLKSVKVSTARAWVEGSLLAGPVGQQPRWQLAVPASGKDVWLPREPMVMAPGSGLVVWAQTVGPRFAASFEWFEEADV